MDLEWLKQKNTKFLASVWIDVPDHLPTIETLDEVNPRNASEVASRLCAIAYVIGLGFGARGRDLESSLEEYGLMGSVSNHERQLLAATRISKQEKINATWLSECAQVLAWAIGLVDLDHFKPCDDDLASKVPFRQSPRDFIARAMLRPIPEIQVQADLLYRMHWYTRNCRLVGKTSLLSGGIISERRRAIDWVYGVEEDWDEIPMDT
jgi:hypothetical protein